MPTISRMEIFSSFILLVIRFFRILNQEIGSLCLYMCSLQIIDGEKKQALAEVSIKTAERKLETEMEESRKNQAEVINCFTNLVNSLLAALGVKIIIWIKRRPKNPNFGTLFVYSFMK